MTGSPERVTFQPSRDETPLVGESGVYPEVKDEEEELRRFFAHKVNLCQSKKGDYLCATSRKGEEQLHQVQEQLASLGIFGNIEEFHKPERSQWRLTIRGEDLETCRSWLAGRPSEPSWRDACFLSNYFFARDGGPQMDIREFRETVFNSQDGSWPTKGSLRRWHQGMMHFGRGSSVWRVLKIFGWKSQDGFSKEKILSISWFYLRRGWEATGKLSELLEVDLPTARKAFEKVDKALFFKDFALGEVNLGNFQEKFGRALDDWQVFFGEKIFDIEEARRALKIPELEPLNLEKIAAEDTVALYFKEAAQEEILEGWQELALALMIEIGRVAEERLERAEFLPEETRMQLEARVQRAEIARKLFAQANLRLVISLAKKYRGHGVSFSDLIQEGNLGLIRAIEKFDWRRGNRFSTYATPWIHQFLGRAIDNQASAIRLPHPQAALVRKIKEVVSEREKLSGQRPTPEEIAEELGIRPEEVKFLLKVSLGTISLEKPVGEDGDLELGDFIEDETTESPEEKGEQRLLAERMKQALETLTPREAKILRLRFGLEDGCSYTLKEVGKQFGLTRERVRQIQNEALRRLQHPRRARLLREYL